ncbi:MULTISPECIES: MFS transporter [Caldilinea]|jgi:MFS family permease|uniref:Putative major facilitator superfamily transporter n=1 Tax=Caldilinea aerophila (strain DSM 14535 / JCM 11387 / NBRC 104270 / STL-6-O1) TaxID=926550 RepID=I0I6L1_CALAS|nr:MULTISPECIES: MFS transporter [Caldilinea]BAM00899.1 putative major facilitator superfamily transporter [Caldilinea aerophila DSM 14535 = NBRC 104270]GIV72239.1 MAG: MFS transporter [Caldilinea sp.]
MAAHVRVFIIFTAAYFLSYFYRSANAVIAPNLAQELALDASQLGLMTSLFFATFAAVQLPLGVGLDRVGPRWVTSALMLVGATGSLLFAFAHSLAALALGRALIGVGMAGVLMGALKAFSRWYSPHRYQMLSGFLVGVGSAGALAAATPLAWLNETVGWRAVFVVGAVLVAGVAAAIAFGTRNTPPGIPWSGHAVDLRVLRAVFCDLRFWRMALLVFFTNGTLLAFQGLWAGPYLNDVYAVDALTRGNVLLLLSAGVTVGFLLSGWLSARLGLAKLVIVGTALFIVTQLVLALHPPLAVMALTGALFGWSGGLTIMLLAQPRYVFPVEVTGQATTAVNLFAIGGAALVQWWMGWLIALFPSVDVRYPPEAYSAALLVTAASTTAMLIFYWPMHRSDR